LTEIHTSAPTEQIQESEGFLKCNDEATYSDENSTGLYFNEKSKEECKKFNSSAVFETTGSLFIENNADQVKINYKSYKGENETLRILTREKILTSTEDNFVACILPLDTSRLVKIVADQLSDEEKISKIIECVKLTKILQDERQTEFQKVFDQLVVQTSLKAQNIAHDASITSLFFNIAKCLRCQRQYGIIDGLVSFFHLFKDAEGSESEMSEAENCIKITQNLANRKTRMIHFPQYEDDVKLYFDKIDDICRQAEIDYGEYLKRHCLEKFHVQIERIRTHCFDGRLLTLRAQDFRNLSDLDSFLKQSKLQARESIFNSHVYQFFQEFQKLKSASFSPKTSAIYHYLVQLLFKYISDPEDKASSLEYDEKWICRNKAHSKKPVVNFILKLVKCFEPSRYLKSKEWHNKFDKLELYQVTGDNLAWMFVLQELMVNSELNHKDSKHTLQLKDKLLKSFAEYLIRSIDLHDEFLKIVDGLSKFYSSILRIKSIGDELSKSILSAKMKILEVSMCPANTEFILNSFIAVVAGFQKFWEYKQTVLDKLTDKVALTNPKKRLIEICGNFLHIYLKTLILVNGKELLPTLLRFVTNFNEFVFDLDALDYNYYVMGELESFETIKWSNDDVGIFDKPDIFIVTGLKKTVNDINQNWPAFYLLNILESWIYVLNHILSENTGQFQTWDNGKKVDATTEFLNTFSKTVVYVNEQTEYLSFVRYQTLCTTYYLKFIERESVHEMDIEEFRTRLQNIVEALPFCRKYKEISFTEATRLLSEINKHIDAENIRLALEKYDQQLHSIGYSDTDLILTEIHEDARTLKKYFSPEQLYSSKKPIHMLVPKMLANIVMIWSKTNLRDVAINPLYIQISCIFLIFGIGNSDRTKVNSILKVLTGQGKSVIIGLASVIWALFDYNVEIRCYTPYLSKRDEEFFSPLIKLLKIGNKITYATFNGMGQRFTKYTASDSKNVIYLGDIIRDIISSKKSKYINSRLKTIVQKKTVLFLDEFDVFLSDEFYSNYRNLGVILREEYFAKIQEKIAEIVIYSENCPTHESTRTLTLNFIEAGLGTLKDDFDEFLHKEGKYKLFSYDKMDFVEHTNQTLWEEHLNKMIKDAIKLRNGTRPGRRYTLNEDGNIVSTFSSHGILTDQYFYGYEDIFQYFRLKEKEFEKNWKKNYGYINAQLCRFSFAHLLCEYTFVFGVTGSLPIMHTNAEAYINKACKFNIFDVPSYLKNSSLIFNSTADFNLVQTESEWMQKIVHHIKLQIDKKRSVIVFFKDEDKLDCFMQEYKSEICFLNKLTENYPPDKKDKASLIFNDVGKPGYVTLATAGMGRGVDYKSSKSVELNGGVHVIQTFFSTEITEETQIKGRTARFDCKGSYELVICKQHLINASFISDETKEINYFTLNDVREKLEHKKMVQSEEKIIEAGRVHEVCMNYIKSFCSSKDEKE